MSIFSRKDPPMPEPIVTGIEAIRAATKIRVKKMSYGILAREIGIANDTLLAFSEGRAQLSEKQLCALARELWQHTIFDPVAD